MLSCHIIFLNCTLSAVQEYFRCYKVIKGYIPVIILRHLIFYHKLFTSPTPPKHTLMGEEEARQACTTEPLSFVGVETLWKQAIFSYSCKCVLTHMPQGVYAFICTPYTCLQQYYICLYILCIFIHHMLLLYTCSVFHIQYTPYTGRFVIEVY